MTTAEVARTLAAKSRHTNYEVCDDVATLEGDLASALRALAVTALEMARAELLAKTISVETERWSDYTAEFSDAVTASILNEVVNELQEKYRRGEA